MWGPGAAEAASRDPTARRRRARFDLNPEEGIDVEYRVRENEDLGRALKRFRRKVQRAGIFRDIKKNRFYEKPSEARRRKAKAAERRRRRRKSRRN